MAAGGTRWAPRAFPFRTATPEGQTMKGILAWAIGIPIPIIILLYVVDVF